MGPAKKRIILSRVLIVLLLVIQVVTPESWGDDSFLGRALEPLGIILLGFAALGRIWSSLFISGKKTHHLVMEGPYSIVRNPLYVFSFIGAVGAGICSENFLTLALIILLFLTYYPYVVRNEEEKLLTIHGQEFRNYANRVPRFIPKFSLYNCPEAVPIDTGRVRKALFDGFVFICIYPAFEILELLRQHLMAHHMFF